MRTHCDEPANGAAYLSCHPVEVKDGWQELVVHTDGPYVTPEAVTIEGNDAEVTNPDGLVDEGAGVRWAANWSPGDTATGVDSFTNAARHEALNGLALLERGIAGQPDAAWHALQRVRRQQPVPGVQHAGLHQCHGGARPKSGTATAKARSI